MYIYLVEYETTILIAIDLGVLTNGTNKINYFTTPLLIHVQLNELNHSFVYLLWDCWENLILSQQSVL